jgi:hypothetical protein
MEASLERPSLTVREAVFEAVRKESLKTTTVKRRSLKRLRLIRRATKTQIVQKKTPL